MAGDHPGRAEVGRPGAERRLRGVGEAEQLSASLDQIQAQPGDLGGPPTKYWPSRGFY